MRAELPIQLGWPLLVAGASVLSATLLIGFLIGPSHGAEAKAKPEECLAQFFQLCPNFQPNESSVRACIAAHKSSFTQSCLELAKGYSNERAAGK